MRRWVSSTSQRLYCPLHLCQWTSLDMEKFTTKRLECHAINIKASIHHSIWMGLKVLHTTTDWWLVEVLMVGARRRQTWSFWFFLLLLQLCSSRPNHTGSLGVRVHQKKILEGEWRLCSVDLLLAGFIHGWRHLQCLCSTTKWSAPHKLSTIPDRPVHLLRGRGGGEGEGVLIQPHVCSVPGFSLDQWLTNDVYAVVLVDICWQNRSPVRHLEWN